MLSLDRMLLLNNTSDHISSAFFEKLKYALEFFEIFSDKFKCSVLVRQKKKKFYGYHHVFFSHSHSF